MPDRRERWPDKAKGSMAERSRSGGALALGLDNIRQLRDPA